MNSATEARHDVRYALREVKLPPLNSYWSSQGGLFRGLYPDPNGGPDRALIEAVDTLPRGDWSASLEAAKRVEIDGHRDFSLPDRAQAALLAAVAKNDHEQTWYWTSEQHASDPEGAWYQSFTDGYQFYGWKASNGIRARAVRSFSL